MGPSKFVLACIGVFFFAQGCVTPEKPSSTSPKSTSTAVVSEKGFISIAGPNGIAQAEFSLSADFGKATGEWSSKLITNVDEFLDPDSSLKLFGGIDSDNRYVFTDVEDYQQNKDRDPAIAVYFNSEKLERIVYGGWQSFVSNSRDELKKIQRTAGKYTVKSEEEELTLKFSLVVDWNKNPPVGVFFQSHVETEGRVPEEVEIADQWSFNSPTLKFEDAKCSGCKTVSVSRNASDDGTQPSADFVVIELGPDRKPRGIKSGGLTAKISK
jgi:hypothetical protein